MMERVTVQNYIRTAKTLTACKRAQEALATYLEEHPEDTALLMEGESLFMTIGALEELSRLAQNDTAHSFEIVVSKKPTRKSPPKNARQTSHSLKQSP